MPGLEIGTQLGHVSFTNCWFVLWFGISSLEIKLAPGAEYLVGRGKFSIFDDIEGSAERCFI